MGRPQRLIEVLTAIQARRQTTAAALADELGVSTRTVLRDVQVLLDAGIPVLTERGRYGGISLPAEGQIDLSKLTAGEADLLRALGLDLDRARQLGDEAAARSVLGKLSARRATPGAPRRPPLALADVITIDNRPWFSEPESQPDVAGLARDLRTGRRLRIRYRSSGSRTAQAMTVDPYGLLQRGGRWYLIADRDRLPGMFALVRLQGWEVLETPRQLRAGADLAATARDLGRALEAGRRVEVTARIDRDRLDMARRILGARLTTARSRGGDKRVTITVAYEELDGVRQLLQFSDHIEVIAPAAARGLIHRLASSLARTHAPASGARGEI